MNFHLPTRRVFGKKLEPSPFNPALPTEVVIKVLYELTLVDLLLCRQVSKRFNHAITNSLLLQYRIELGVGAMVDRPGKHSTLERLEALRKYRFGWRNLAWRRRDIVNVDHPRGSLCQLSGGLFVSGKKEKPGMRSKLLFVELPSSTSKPGAPRRSELECDIEVAHMAVDVEQDLLVLIEDRSRAAHGPQFRVHLRSLTTNYPHPGAASSILEYDCKSGWYNYQFMIQIMGKHVGILFTSGILGDSDFERLVIWDWTRGNVRGTISMPNSRYDAFTFISEYALALPCARTESINIFVFRPAPQEGYGDPGPYIRHVCALQLPPLVPGAKYISIHCHSQPAPSSRATPRRRGGLRRPDKLFEADHSDGIVSFPIHCFNHSGNRAKDLTLIAHRSTLLSLMPVDAMADLFSTKTSVLVFWEPYGMCPTEAWGPPIPWEWWGAASCRFTLDRRPPSLLNDTYGHRIARLIHEGNPYAAHLRVQDYNPLSLRHPILLEDDHNPTLEQHVCRKIVTDSSILEADGFFQVDVVTRLPYYEVTTLAPFTLTGVMLDDERVVGMKTDSPGGDDIVAVDVFIM